MDSIWDFIRAASPWVAMGLLLAIFFVRSAVKKKKGKKQDGDYGTEGMHQWQSCGDFCGNGSCYAMKKITSIIVRRFARFAREVFGVKETDDAKAAELGIEKVREFNRSLEMPSPLTEVGILQDKFDKMAAEAACSNQKYSPNHPGSIFNRRY